MLQYSSPEPSDYNGILHLNNLLVQKYAQKGSEAWQLTKPDLTDQLDHSHTVIAKNEGEVAGYLLTFPIEAETTFSKPVIKHFLDIYPQRVFNQLNLCVGQVCVHPEFQRQGIAREMHQKFESINEIYDGRIVDIDKDEKGSLKLHLEMKNTLLKIAEIPPGFDSVIYASVYKNLEKIKTVLSAKQ